LASIKVQQLFDETEYTWNQLRVRVVQRQIQKSLDRSRICLLVGAIQTRNRRFEDSSTISELQWYAPRRILENFVSSGAKDCVCVCWRDVLFPKERKRGLMGSLPPSCLTNWIIVDNNKTLASTISAWSV